MYILSTINVWAVAINATNIINVLANLNRTLLFESDV